MRSDTDALSRRARPSAFIRRHVWLAGPRSVHAGSYLETFVVSAVVCLLVVRAYLKLTGYPRIGNGEIHIAHWLPGGLAMVSAQVLLLAFIGRRSRQVAAVVGGIGFGLFIDELGKSITTDADYFFHPTIALIYLVFIALSLGIRAIAQRALSPRALIVNASDSLTDAIIGGATRTEVAHTLRLLQRSGSHGQLTAALHAALTTLADASHDVPSSRVQRVAEWAWRIYDLLVVSRWFDSIMVAAFSVRTLVALLASIRLVVALGSSTASLSPDTTVAGLGLAGALASVLCAVIGLISRHRSLLAAYVWLKRSVLVSIYVTQLTLFWADQFQALGGLLIDLSFLLVVSYLIHQEQARPDGATTRTA
jgi:hypothetical protein